jgi:hypothetical protein
MYPSLLIFATLFGIIASQSGSNPPNYPTGKIELTYYSSGPWDVSISSGTACCDSSNNKFDLYYPTHLGANKFAHPILTWGNGSSGESADCAYLLTHMASWGFVVIATEDKTTGPGQTMLDAANFLINANKSPDSIFYHKLNIDRVGAFGASQGATGAVNAMIRSHGLIRTAVTIELPAQKWCSSATNCVDTGKLKFGSIFFIDGSTDAISPPFQLPWEVGEQSTAGYYDAVPSTVNKLKGTLRGPNHNDVTGQPSCQQSKWPCANGVYGYLGYPTAWMMVQLQSDLYAGGAFTDVTGEIFSNTTNWEYVASNLR